MIYLVLVGLMVFLFLRMPTAYLPQEDQGVMYIQALLPAGSTMEQTQQVLDQVREYFLNNEKAAVQGVFTVAGRGFSGAGQNTGLGFVMLKDWHERPGANLKVNALAGRAMARFAQIRNARVFAFPPPAVLELGRAGGFDFELQDRAGLGHEELMAARNQLLGMAAQDPRLTRVRPAGLEDVTQYRVDVDWEKAGALGVPISAIHNTISSAFGSAYVNDFIQGGRVKRVYVQADAPYRMLPKDLERLYVRNAAGTMTPFSAFATGHWFYGPPLLERFNSFPALNIWGEPAPGRSSGEAMQAMEEMVAKLPKGIGFDWAGLSFQERLAKAQAPVLYAFSILVIFLCVAALYESWTIPFANLLMLPLGLLGATVATSLRGLPNDVYFQIGVLTTLGLIDQERHPDYSVCQGTAEPGRRAGGSDPGRHENQVPSGHHDVIGLFLRRAPLGHNYRRRRRRPERHRHCGGGRHDVRHLYRSLFHSAVLCPGLQSFPKAAATASH